MKDEIVKLNFKIPVGYKFKSLANELKVGDFVLLGNEIKLVHTDVRFKDKQFPYSFFIVIERV